MRQAIDIGSAQDPVAEIRRLFDLQAASRWPVSRSTASERRKKLQRFKASLEKHRAALAEGIRRELGRAPEESEVIDIHPSLDELNYAIAHLAEWMRPEPVEAPLLLADTASEIRWEPRGQVLVLSPWNYPILVTIGPLVGAIAAGNV
ncbi:MAG TPA: aldehyde dehydrogenase family protein, partial [Myxococcaceae bacterium]|nr:aldehyde dehydrogenase family protein [Myxococcaceae bacterium]